MYPNHPSNQDIKYRISLRMIIEKNMDTLMYSWILTTQKNFGNTHNIRNIFFYIFIEKITTLLTLVTIWNFPFVILTLEIPSPFFKFVKTSPFQVTCLVMPLSTC
jgi:hypothetical protein